MVNQHVLISANPKSGSQSGLKRVAELREAIEKVGLSCELLTDLKEVAERSQLYCQQGRLRTVVAAGGDGTAAIVASLIPNSVPLTLFPTGSENLLAKYLRCDANVMRCAASIVRGSKRKLDVMQVNGKRSLLMASVGFDAEVVRRVHESRKSHITRWAYRWAILTSIMTYRWPTLDVTIMDTSNQCTEVIQGNWVFVFNVPRYAAGLSIVPDALDSDGLLDVGIFAPGGLLRGLWYYWHVVRGSHSKLPAWRRIRVPALRIQSSGKASCQTDGDWEGWLPTEISIAPQQLELIV
jgi:diacylglycerol kinase family enzyme